MLVSMKSPTKILLALVSICVVIQSSDAEKTPHWVRSCPQKGPLPVDECVVKVMNDALPFIIKGYPRYHIPQLDPLKISSLSIGSGSKQIGLSLKMTNTNIWGIKNDKFYNSKVDIPNRSWEVMWSSPRLELLGDFSMDGKMLVLPIKGDGPGNITLTDVSGDFKMSWEYYKKKGKDYARITASSMDFKAGRAYFRFQNLFNGDKYLGAQMNTFMNENWAEVIHEFGPAVGDALNLVFRQLIQNILDLVPFDSIFPANN